MAERCRIRRKLIAALSYGGMRPALKPNKKCAFYSSGSLQLQAIGNALFVLPQTFRKGRFMNRHLISMSAGTLLALAAAGAFAQSTPPASGASAPGTVGVTPAEAAKANQQAVPRSDTATVVRTAPSPASQASAAMGGTTGTAATTGTTGTANTTGAARTAGSAGQSGMATGGSRSARADRN